MTGHQERAWAAIRQAPQLGLSTIGGRTDPWSQWATAVLIMSTGDFREAFRILEPLIAAGDEVGGLAAARIASGLRQMDEHAEAVAWDDRAMAVGGQALVDGLIGRAADAVGAADPASAAGYLATAARGARQLRDQVRVSWVACEISLLKGHAQIATAHAERAHKMSVTMGSPRHIVKSTLFWAASARDLNERVALDLLHRGYTRAKALALRPLLWPMVAVLGDLASPEQRAVAGHAVEYIRAHLPPGHGSGWSRREDLHAFGLTA